MKTKRQQLAMRVALGTWVLLCAHGLFAADIEVDKTPDPPPGFEAIKMTVRTNGIYYVEADYLATLMDVAADDVKDLIASGGVSLRNQGRELGYLPQTDGDGLYFYGVATESEFSSYNVYWLHWYDGVPVTPSANAPPADGGAATKSRHMRHEEQDVYSHIGYSDDIEKDNWTWDFILAGVPPFDVKDFTVYADGRATSPARARLTTYLQAVSTVNVENEHRATVQVNGTEVGQGIWSGATAHEFTATFDQSLLAEGSNTITVTGHLAAGIDSSYLRVDSFDLEYLRTHTAADDQLVLRPGNNALVTVTGFTNDTILVVGVVDGDSIEEMPAVTVEGGPVYRATFQPTDDTTDYAVFAASDRPEPDTIEAVTIDTLTGMGNDSRYVVITVPEFGAAATNLVAHRDSAGLSSRVIYTDEVYNDFNHGMPSPWAIRNFLAYTESYWSQPVEYVVLAGDCSYDYRDIRGFGDNIVPTGFVNTPDALFSSDVMLADFDDDGIPEISIGRLPVMSNAELQTIVDKIIHYESTATASWKTHVVFIADLSDDGGNFDESIADAAAMVPGEYTKEFISRTEYSLPTASNLLKQAINDGAAFINFFGHGARLYMSKDHLFGVNGVSELSNSNKLAIMTSMSCALGQYAAVSQDCLGEELLLGANTGIAAVWAPSGRSMNTPATRLNEFFFDAIFNRGKTVLGDATREALAAYGESGVTPYMSRIYNLIGDPAMEIAGFYATYGLVFSQWQSDSFTTAEQEDQNVIGWDRDPDGDGILNIIEYAILTDPRRFNDLGNVFTIDESQPIGQTPDTYDLVITYTRRKGINDVTFVVEASADLVSWSNDPQWIVGEEILDSGDPETERVNVYVKTPDPQRLKGFVRMRFVYNN